MKKSLSSKILLIILYLMLAISIILTLAVPFTLDYYAGIFYDYGFWDNHRGMLITFLMGLGSCGTWIFVELLLMLHSIPKDPFLPRNVNALKRTGVAAFFASILFFLKSFVKYSFGTTLCAIALIIAMLFCFTLSDLFQQAVSFKEENEFTI